MNEPALTISVIVPVYRDSIALTTLLLALSKQVGIGPEAFELIVVDNDPAGPDALKSLPETTFLAQIVGCLTPGSYAARNAGAKVARGAYLVFTDADCRPAPGWLAAMADALATHPDTLLAGPVLLDPGPDPSDWAIFDTVRGIPQAAFVSRGYAATANLACERTLFDRIGGFAEDRLSGGDAEFCRRAGRRGIKLLLVADAPVHHPARATLTALVTKAHRIKGGQVAAGPIWRRVIWTLRSFMPPLREMFAYLRAPHCLRWRLIACQIRMRLWGVEMVEVMRLLVFRTSPERR